MEINHLGWVSLVERRDTAEQRGVAMNIKITGIRKLTDGTVTFTGTTEKANYLPLVMLDNDGKDIHLSVEQEEVKESTFMLFLRDMIAKFEREAYERGIADAVQGDLITPDEKGEQK